MVKIGPRRRLASPPKKALLIGINYADVPADWEFPPLRRAQADTREFRQLLIDKYDYVPDNIVMMLDCPSIRSELQPTRANIRTEIRKLVKDAQAGSWFVFFYSGHSGQVSSPQHHMEEDDGLDEYIVPVDHSQIPVREGQSLRKDMKKRMILDNKLRKLLVDRLPVGAHLTAIFDSCHSGTMLDLDHYLCNSMYYPWKTPGFRRYKTMWQHVRRQDGQRMSQSDVQVVTTQRKYPDSADESGHPSVHLSRDNSVCSVRIYEHKRVSNDEIQVVNTSVVGVSGSEDGSSPQYSVRSRRTSIQCRAGSSIAQIMEEGEYKQSIDTLGEDKDEEGFGPRCLSPTSIKCNGFCAEPASDEPPDSATVLSISSCQDQQRTWESKRDSFAQELIGILRRDPNQPLGQFLQQLMYKMYGHATRTHRWSQKRKESWKLKHPETGSGSTLETASDDDDAEVEHLHYLDNFDYVDIPEPQLGAQHRLDLTKSVRL